MKEHNYSCLLRWTGNKGSGTSAYEEYTRDHECSFAGKSRLECSSDPAFRGDPGRYNPEELFLASISSCHMLWYLHLCAVNSVIVTEYTDEPEAVMSEDGMNGGRFTSVLLKPTVTVSSAEMHGKAEALHKEAHRLCFISNSLNFEVNCMAKIQTLK